MPTITKISEQKRSPNRRNIFLDGAFAFGVNLNVVARFLLREGMTLTLDQVQEIEAGDVRQECFDQAMKYLTGRLHSRKELQAKLNRREYGQSIVTGVLDDLQRLGYLDDARFARTKAMSAAEHKHHGKRRAMMELRKAGVSSQDAESALNDVYGTADSASTVRQLVEKRLPQLRRLDPVVAKRRLMGILQRRGFGYDEIKPILDAVFKLED